MDAWAYGRYDAIVCISAGVKEALAEWVDRPHPPLWVIPNGVDGLELELQVASRSAPPVVVTVGRLVEAKNIEAAIRAFTMLGDLDVEYWIAGDGPLRADLEALVARCGLVGRVQFLGYREDVAALLRQASVFLLPSVWEGFGLAVVEAMNAGLPVACSDISGLREVVGADGVLFEPRDPASIARAIRDLIMDPQDNHDLCRRAHRRSLAFSAEAMAVRYREVYLDALGRNSDGRDSGPKVA